MKDLDWSQVDPKEIPSDLVFKNPAVNELSDSFVASLGDKIPFPYIIKDKVLMSEGVWNSYYYSNSVIEDAYKSTDWNDRTVRNLFLDHEDLRASEWVGEVDNVRMKGNSLRGDLIIYDPVIAAKMSAGKPKVGISPKVKGDVDRDSKSMESFTFQNFSIVMNPAVKTAYINNMEVQNPMAEEKEEEEKASEKSPKEEKQEEKQKEPVTKEQAKKKKKPEDEDEDEEIKKKDKKKDEDKYPYPEELSAYTDFVKKMKKKNPDWSFKKIADAWKKSKGKKNSELEEVKSQLGELISLLKSNAKKDKDKDEDEDEEEEENEEKEEVESKMAEISDKLSALEMKMEEPDKLSVKGTQGAGEQMDDSEGFYKYLEALDKAEGGRSR